MIECPKNWMVDINHNHSFHSATWKFFHFPLSPETCLLVIEMVKRKYPFIKQSTPPDSCTMYLYEVLSWCTSTSCHSVILINNLVMSSTNSTFLMPKNEFVKHTATAGSGQRDPPDLCLKLGGLQLCRQPCHQSLFLFTSLCKCQMAS